MISSSSSHTCTQTHTRILCPSVLFYSPSSISLSSHSSSLETLIIPTIPRFISTIILFPLLSPLLSLFLSFLPSGATCWADCFFLLQSKMTFSQFAVLQHVPLSSHLSQGSSTCQRNRRRLHWACRCISRGLDALPLVASC